MRVQSGNRDRPDGPFRAGAADRRRVLLDEPQDEWCHAESSAGTLRPAGVRRTIRRRHAGHALSRMPVCPVARPSPLPARLARPASSATIFEIAGLPERHASRVQNEISVAPLHNIVTRPTDGRGYSLCESRMCPYCLTRSWKPTVRCSRPSRCDVANCPPYVRTYVLPQAGGSL